MWVGGASIHGATWAQHAWERIQRRPVSVVVVRGNTPQLAQTVRVELKTSASERMGEGGVSSTRRVGVVFAVRNHPTLADGNFRRGDVFALDGVKYRVVDVVRYPGEYQVSVEAMQ